jgi:endonuclease/exonuclease/phosphatase family metal-dependent hydrolase
VPDDEPQEREPRLDVSRAGSWRAACVAGAVVVGLVAVFAVVVWVLGSPGASPSGTGGSGSTVLTAPASTAPTGQPPQHGQHHRPIRDPLEPVKIHRDPTCPIRPPQIIRVMQFNIHAGVSRFGGVGLPRIAAEIRAAHPDVVSLNEVDDGTIRSGHADEPAYLATATGMRAVYGPNLFDYDGGRFGNAILSRFPIVASHNTRLPRLPHSEPRGLLEASLRIGHRIVSFYSVHLTQGGHGTAQRVSEAEAAAHVVQASSDPVILSGDLNSRPQDLPVRILRQYLIDAQEQGGTGAGLTVPEADPHSRIDYILYDNHFAAVPGSTQVLPSGSSDHRSVWTELVLRPKGQC